MAKTPPRGAAGRKPQGPRRHTFTIALSAEVRRELRCRMWTLRRQLGDPAISMDHALHSLLEEGAEERREAMRAQLLNLRGRQ